ncbi:MAG: hypothetical protein ACO1SV_11340 [Fimbriimonas sp.]
MSVLAAGLAVLLTGEVKLRVVRMRTYLNGKEFGIMTYSRAFHPDGGRTTTQAFKARRASMTTRQVVRCDREGNPVRMENHTVARGAKSTAESRVVATFDARGANYESAVSGKRRTQRFPRPAGSSTADPGWNWFEGEVPRPGQVAENHVFSLLRPTGWILRKTIYRGRVKYRYGRRSVSAHRLELRYAGKVGSLVVDDRGMPLTIDNGGGVKFVRMEEGK